MQTDSHHLNRKVSSNTICLNHTRHYLDILSTHFYSVYHREESQLLNQKYMVAMATKLKFIGFIFLKHSNNIFLIDWLEPMHSNHVSLYTDQFAVSIIIM